MSNPIANQGELLCFGAPFESPIEAIGYAKTLKLTKSAERVYEPPPFEAGNFSAAEWQWIIDRNRRRTELAKKIQQPAPEPVKQEEGWLFDGREYQN